MDVCTCSGIKDAFVVNEMKMKMIPHGLVGYFRMDGVLKEKLYEFHNHNAACAAVQFAQDSSTLVSAGLDAR